MRANIYIDGFNVYYNLVRGTNYKWLNLGALCTTLFPLHDINSIKYFTANVQSRPHDPQASIRQEVYLRALRTIPNLSIIKGRFVAREKKLPYSPLSYTHPELLANLPLAVPVIRTEEKQSDVNLATHLLVDCFKGEFDIGIVISNDADLKLPIEMVVNECGKDIGIVNPQRRNDKYVHRDLARMATLRIDKINS